MTSHELAKLLLASENLPVYVINEDDQLPQSVRTAKVNLQKDWTHFWTKEPITRDADSNLLPEKFLIVGSY